MGSDDFLRVARFIITLTQDPMRMNGAKACFAAASRKYTRMRFRNAISQSYILFDEMMKSKSRFDNIDFRVILFDTCSRTGASPISRGRFLAFFSREIVSNSLLGYWYARCRKYQPLFSYKSKSTIRYILVNTLSIT